MVITNPAALKQITNNVDRLIDIFANKYSETTGDRPSADMIKFVKAMFRTTIDFLEQAASDPSKISLRTIGRMSVDRALAVAGFTMNKDSKGQCVVATMTFALATVDYGEELAGSALFDATVVGGPVGVALALSATAFWAAQLESWIETCGDAFYAMQRESLPPRFDFTRKSALIRHRAMSLGPMAFVG